MTKPTLVVGAYGYRNTGDEAILAGLLESLPAGRVTVVSRSPAETAALHGVDAIGLGAAVAALRRHGTVVIGGGGLFGRDMGRIGRLLPLYGLLAVALGRSLIVIGVGIDPGMRGIQALLVRRMLRAAERITVRDAASAAALREWGIDSIVADDLSARMAPVAARVGRTLLRATGIDGRRPVVGLCLTAVNASLVPAIRDGVLAVMRRHPELEFCFVPMSQHPYLPSHNDLLLAQWLQAAWPAMKVVEGSHHPSVVLSLFGSLDAVVGMRYHSLLFAERAGIPLLPLTYAEKCDIWLAERDLRAVRPTAAALSRALTRSLVARSIAS